jgi:hypothetical protein
MTACPQVLSDLLAKKAIASSDHDSMKCHWSGTFSEIVPILEAPAGYPDALPTRKERTG